MNKTKLIIFIFEVIFKVSQKHIFVMQKKEKLRFHHYYKREILFEISDSDSDVFNSFFGEFFQFLFSVVTNFSRHRPSPSAPSWHVAGLYKENVSERQCNVYSSHITL